MLALLVPGAAIAAPGPADTPVEACRLVRSGPQPDVGEGFPVSSFALPATGETMKAAAIYVDFSDVVGTEQDLAATRAEMENDIDYLTSMSGGAYSVDVVEPAGWVRMPQLSTDYLFVRTSMKDADTAEIFTDAVNAADSQIDFSDIDVLWVYVVRGTSTVQTAARMVQLRGRISTADGNVIDDGIILGSNRRTTPFTLGHEMSHVFGMPDLYIDVNRPGYDPVLGIRSPYGSWEDLDGPTPEWFAWHRWVLGWIPDEEVVCLPESGKTTVRLRPVEASTSHSPARDALAVIPLSSTKAIVVESRQPLGFDKNLTQPGVLIYTVDSTLGNGGAPIRVVDAHPTPFVPGDKYAGLIDAAFLPGESYTNPEAGTIVRVLDDEDGTAVIQVARL
ncbi:hypothetical protein ACUOFU_05130 [Microbacterium arabinogalactanolyticum]|uniref:hypothetical protein n=1 Tax=Microbacterium arabinogalactanolyticum TaxID=69365 RepID=UPI004044390E